MTWEKQPPYEGRIYQGCLNCPPVTRQASMEMLIAVGFGVAQVTKDEELIYTEPINPESWEDLPTLNHFEQMAQEDPDHDWRVLLEAPLRSREYQRQGPEEWVLIASGPGFA